MNEPFLTLFYRFSGHGGVARTTEGKEKRKRETENFAFFFDTPPLYEGARARNPFVSPSRYRTYVCRTKKIARESDNSETTWLQDATVRCDVTRRYTPVTREAQSRNREPLPIVRGLIQARVRACSKSARVTGKRASLSPRLVVSS